jgi:hypothetical protein
MRYLIVLFLSLSTYGCHIIMDPLTRQVYVGLPGFQPDAVATEINSSSYQEDLEVESASPLDVKDIHVEPTPTRSEDSLTHE